jgi:hypothetical protein
VGIRENPDFSYQHTTVQQTAGNGAGTSTSHNVRASALSVCQVSGT